MPTTIEALVIIALMLSPGYVFAQLAGGVLAFARTPSDLRFLLPTITCGTAAHLAMSPWTVRIIDFYRDDDLASHPVELALWGTALVFIAPAFLGIGLGRLSNVPWVDRALDRIGLGYVDRTPSAWDYVVRLERPGFMRVHLKDGRMVGGVFYAESFASTTPERADLYLEQAWQLDDVGNFVRPLLDNQGVWIAHDTMSHVEFFTQGESEGQQDEHEAGTVLPDQADATAGQRQAGSPAEDAAAVEPGSSAADASGE